MFVSDCIDEGTVLDADTNGEVFCTLPMDEDDNCWRSSADVEGNVAL